MHPDESSPASPDRAARVASARPLPARLGCALAAFIVAWASGCGSEPTSTDASTAGAATDRAATLPDAAPGARNVLLVSVDTLRLDRLGFAGNPRPTSPHMDRLAQQGLRFDHAYSQSGWTLPSMASIMTGLPPGEHGATHFHRGMDRKRATLASLLRERGYDTRAYVSHILLTPKYGFDTGFDEFDASALALGRPADVSTASMLTDAALRALDDVRAPFFIWVHYFDPHFRYQPHAQWRAFGDSTSDLYDQEIAWTDFQIGRLLAGLEASGRADDTVVILTADHGEEFGDHGGEYHYTLHEEVIRVPLLMRVPGEAPRRVSTPAAQIDLLPTILAAAGLEVPSDLPGRNLLATPPPAAPIFIERERPAGFRQRAIVSEGRKLVVIEEADPEETRNAPPTPTRVRNVEPGVLYFDLEADPHERSPLDPGSDPRARALLEELVRHSAAVSTGAGPDVDLSTQTEAELRSLGYLE